jgi:hypothetical protein
MGRLAFGSAFFQFAASDCFGDERLNEVNSRENVLHSGDERQNHLKLKSKCLSYGRSWPKYR